MPVVTVNKLTFNAVGAGFLVLETAAIAKAGFTSKGHNLAVAAMLALIDGKPLT
jgi:hypothetical protein